jgi:hypothetical protein
MAAVAVHPYVLLANRGECDSTRQPRIFALTGGPSRDSRSVQPLWFANGRVLASARKRSPRFVDVHTSRVFSKKEQSNNESKCDQSESYCTV